MQKNSKFRVAKGHTPAIAESSHTGAALSTTSKNVPAGSEGLELGVPNEKDAYTAMERYVISVNDVQGRMRLAQLKFLDGDGYKVVHGITPEHLPTGAWAKFFVGRCDDKRNALLNACLHSHFKAWKQLYSDGDRGGMIFEDDIVQYRACSRNPACYCATGLTYLAGAIKSFGSWVANDSEQGVQETLLALLTLKLGANDVPDFASKSAGRLTGSLQEESLRASIVG